MASVYKEILTEINQSARNLRATQSLSKVESGEHLAP